MKIKKIKLALGAFASILAPVSLVLACGNSSNENPWISKIKTRTLNKKGSYKDSKISLITDSGIVTENAFDQAAWAGTEVLAKQAKVKSSFIKTSAYPGLLDTYDKAIADGYKVLVLPGYAHQDIWGQSEKGVSEGVVAVLIDGSPIEKTKNITYGLQYRSEQAAILAGYGTAQYLVEIKRDSSPKVGAWAGYNGPGEINYTLGFLAGVALYNKLHPDSSTVTFAGDQILVNSLFPEAKDLRPAQVLKDNGADVLFAVANEQITKALTAADGTDIKVVGFDVDQSLVYPDDKDKFLTSVIKDIGQSVYDTLYKIYSNDETGKGTTTWGDLDNHSVGLAASHVEGEETKRIFEDLSSSDNDIYKKAAAYTLPDEYYKKTEATLKGESGGLTIATVTPDDFKQLGITNVQGASPLLADLLKISN